MLHTVAYDDPIAGRVRPIAHRLSLAEMIVPYRDPSPDHARRTAFDIGEWGLGFMTTSLELGCDCLGEIRYLDAVLHDTAGEPYTIINAICLHEEDNGVLWKHVDDRTGAEVRRMRRMVISSHMTVANYEYLVYWRLYQDGSIECEIRATGIMVTTPFEGEPPPYGTVVDINTYAPIHQHFLVARLDLEVDGPDNTVMVTRHRRAAYRSGQPARTRADAARRRRCAPSPRASRTPNWASQRSWKVVNPHRLNRAGTPVAYKLVAELGDPGADRSRVAGVPAGPGDRAHAVGDAVRPGRALAQR